MKKIPTSVRADVRQEYLEGKGSCRELAQKYGVSPAAVENWCRREGWRKRVKEIDRRLTVQTERSLANHADALVAQRAAFMNRTVGEGNAWLDEIDAERESRKRGDVETLRKVVTCWDTVTTMQRKSLRLDQEEQRATCILNLAVLREEPKLIFNEKSG